MPYAEDAMEFIYDCRVKYCKKIGLKGKKRKNYIQAWVANYEISDYFIENKRDIHFARFNQSSEYKVATFEERDRLVEEFGMGVDVNVDTFDLVFISNLQLESLVEDIDERNSLFLWEYFSPDRNLISKRLIMLFSLIF